MTLLAGPMAPNDAEACRGFIYMVAFTYTSPD